MLKNIGYGLAAIGLVACAATQYDPEIFHLTSDVYFINEIKAASFDRNGTTIVNITGTSSSDTTVFYRVVWLDENGTPIRTTLSNPVEARVRAEVPFNWTAVAPNNDTHKYQVFISGRVINQ